MTDANAAGRDSGSIPSQNPAEDRILVLAKRIESWPGREHPNMKAENWAHARAVEAASQIFKITEQDINNRAADIWIQEGRVEDNGASMFRHHRMALQQLVVEAQAKLSASAETGNGQNGGELVVAGPRTVVPYRTYSGVPAIYRANEVSLVRQEPNRAVARIEPQVIYIGGPARNGGANPPPPPRNDNIRAERPEPRQPREEEPRRRKIWPWIAGGVAVATLASVFTYKSLHDKPVEKPAEKPAVVVDTGPIKLKEVVAPKVFAFKANQSSTDTAITAPEDAKGTSIILDNATPHPHRVLRIPVTGARGQSEYDLKNLFSLATEAGVGAVAMEKDRNGYWVSSSANAVGDADTESYIVLPVDLWAERKNQNYIMGVVQMAFDDASKGVGKKVYILHNNAISGDRKPGTIDYWVRDIEEDPDVMVADMNLVFSKE